MMKACMKTSIAASLKHVGLVSHHIPYESSLCHHKVVRATKLFSSKSPQQSLHSDEGINVQIAKQALYSAQAVCFDVDSTVCTEEGIDVLASFCGVADAVADLTKQAMGGNVLFQDAIKMRLDLMKPKLHTVQKCLQNHPPKLSLGISELIKAMNKRGIHTYLVSGGFRIMIEPVAKSLGIPEKNIFANTLLFDNAGNYAGFDNAEPTCRDGGKPLVIKNLIEKFNYSTIVMVGDGATDMQARPPATAFIGYGGVTVREPVRNGSDWFVYNFDDMIRIVSSETAPQ